MEEEEEYPMNVFEQQIHQTDTKVLREAISAFFEHSNVMFIIVRSTGEIILSNAIWAKKTGWTQAQLKKMRIEDLTHPEDLEKTLDAVQQITKERLLISGFHNRWKKPSGEWIKLDWHGYSSKDGKYMFGVAVPDYDEAD